LWGEQSLETWTVHAPCCVGLAHGTAAIQPVALRDPGDDLPVIIDLAADGSGRLFCTSPIDGSVQDDHGRTTFAQLGKRIDATGTTQVELSAASRSRVQLGALTYVLDVGRGERVPGIRKRAAWSKAGKIGLLATTFAHTAAIVALAVLSPPGPDTGEVTDEQLALIRYYVRAAAEREARTRGDEGGAQEQDYEGGGSTRGKGDFGFVGGDLNAPTAAWGRDVSGGTGVMGVPLAPSGTRYGIIGPSASGGGNAPTASGPVPLPETGIGHAAGTGYGSGQGRLGGSHRTRPPTSGVAPGGGATTLGSPPSARLAPAKSAAAGPSGERRTEIDRNGRFATTYRPGRGHLTAFETSVKNGVIPSGHRALVAGMGARHVPDLDLAPGEAMAFSTALERTHLPPSGGSFHLRVAMQSAPRVPPGRPKLSVHLVIDTSGSMTGDPIRHARDAARAVVRKLKPSDEFSLVTFASGGTVKVPGGPVGTRRKAIDGAIASIRADGGTNLGEGLQLGYAQANGRSQSEDAVRVVLVVSDGQANEGIIDRGRLSRIALAAFQQGVQTSTFGVGIDYDGPLMSRVAADGAGGYYYLPSSERIASALTSELGKRLQPVATAMEIRVRLHPGVDLLHVYGSGRLDAEEAARVRATEVAADRHAETRDGIRKNRQRDREGGMRFFIPAFAAGDRHALLLDLRAPAGVGAQKVGLVEVRYKDRLAKRNCTHEIPVRITYANSAGESAKTADPSVMRTIQGFKAGESLLAASRWVQQGSLDRALAEVSEREVILLEAAARYHEPVFLDDAARLARLRSKLDVRSGQLALAMLLETAGRASL